MKNIHVKMLMTDDMKDGEFNEERTFNTLLTLSPDEVSLEAFKGALDSFVMNLLEKVKGLPEVNEVH